MRFLPGLSIDEVVRYYQGDFNLKGWNCLLPWHTMRISPYGDVYPCLNVLIGNIKEKKIQSLWNSAPYSSFRQSLKKDRIFPACVGCCKMQRSSSG
jgi:radical SAM protein with 4Fe4S-binding SPASM domain